MFPYRFLTGVDKFDHVGLPPIEEFGSVLGQGSVFKGDVQQRVRVEPITAKDYEHAQEVFCKFGCKTFGEYVRLCCESDVELLAIVFERFIRTTMEEFGIDPSGCYSSAGFFREAMLKMTGVKPELLTDSAMYAFFEKCVRGGVPMVCKRLADANSLYANSLQVSLRLRRERALLLHRRLGCEWVICEHHVGPPAREWV